MDSVSGFIVPAGPGVEKAEGMGKPAEMLTPCGLRGGPGEGGRGRVLRPKGRIRLSAPSIKWESQQHPLHEVLGRIT